MPNTRFKPDPFYHGDKPENKNTFCVSTKFKPFIFKFFCYHCFFGWLGQTINDWRKSGATEDEISDWISGINDKTPKESIKELINDIL